MIAQSAVGSTCTGRTETIGAYGDYIEVLNNAIFRRNEKILT